MKEVKGNIWDFHEAGEIICITTNKTLKKDGSLVMGRGIALEARERFPGLANDWGMMVDMTGGKVIYSFKPNLIMFPTKEHWRKPSTLDIILKSSLELINLIQLMNLKKVYLPRVGCGNGGLEWNEVKNEIEKILPDNCIIVHNDIGVYGV